MLNGPWDSPSGTHRIPLRGHCNSTELIFTTIENGDESCKARVT